MNFNPKFPNLMSPYKVGNVVLKNRMLASPSRPHFIQGPESYPTEKIITHYQNKAKNGAAVVTCNIVNPMPGTDGRVRSLDYKDPACQNYISQMVESIHYYGSKASFFPYPFWADGFDVSDGIHGEGPHGAPPGKQIPEKMLYEMIEDYADQAAAMQEMGFDMAYMHMAYRGMLIARFLSPLTNLRTDDFGGSLENRIRFPLMVCKRIKEKCGKDFLLEVAVSGEDQVPGGVTIEDTIEFIKRGVGYFDLVQLRSGSIDPNHPTGYTKEHIPFLYMAEAVKKSGVDMPVETIGGCFYPEDCEEAIASGKTDFVSMARSWITNLDYGQKVYEGRSEDIVPCLRCNKCHRSSENDTWLSVCSVNPVWGLEHKIEKMVAPVTREKRIAVVGGGPGGMEAALVSSERGHKVTLYEKESKLGGQLNAGGTPGFKWPLKDFKEYLIRQVEKSNIKVCLGTEATAELLKPESYDEVIVAVGADPIVPKIKGVDGKNVHLAIDVYGNEDKLAKDVVVIGGGEVGVETGMHLAEKGHKVTLIEMLGKLAPDATPTHFYTMFMDYVQNCEGFEYILNAECTEIREDGITYKDKDGAKQVIKAGSVVVSVGTKARSDEALKLFNPGEKALIVGDCVKAGNVQKTMRSAFAAASQL